MTLATTGAARPRHDHQSCVAEALAHAQDVCESHNRRLTPNRRAVLKLLLADHRALGAYDIIRRFDWKDRRQAPSQVYRALAFLEAMGLVHRVSSRNAYVACYRFSERHGAVLFVCDACGVVSELKEPWLGHKMDAMAQASGFRVQSRLLEAVGRCADCARGAPGARS